MSENIIELSVTESNALRAKLGLKPLKINKPSDPATTNKSEDLSLSISESNALRQKLGLKPLNTNPNDGSGQQGRKASEAIHAPAQNTTEEDRIKERIAEAKLKREVEAGIAKFKQEPNEGDTNLDALSWADRMRAQSLTAGSNSETGTKEKKKKRSRGGKDKDVSANYTDAEFDQQNLTVAHNTSDFDAGTTTVLTLADKSILEAEEDGVNALENVNMSESATFHDNLKRKRMVEMGLGHAGGYAGYDDDEFEELGGSQMILGIDSSTRGEGGPGDSQGGKKRTGFKLGGTIVESKEEEPESDLFAAFKGKSVSLASSGQNGSMHQADFLSYEEEMAMGINVISKDEIERKRKKKEKKLLKKLKKDKKRSRKERKGNGMDHEDQDDQDQEQEQFSKATTSAEVEEDTHVQGTTLLEELAAASKLGNKKRRRRKRRVEVDSDESEDDRGAQKNSPEMATQEDVEMKDEDEAIQEKRKDKFHDIMEKGNRRTQSIFAAKDESKKRNSGKSDELEEVEDDAFLSAAISKARRLRRLRELNSKSNSDGNVTEVKSIQSKGANAVVEALKSMKKSDDNIVAENASNGEGKITFELGTTTEFTRALRAQPIKPDGSNQNQNKEVSAAAQPVKAPAMEKIEVEDVTMEEAEEDKNDNKQTFEELADQVEEEDTMGALGSTGTTAGMGRGMSAFLDMLKQTGEITGKSAGREELRGRAKDEKTYDDYAPLDLKNVVKLDTTGLRAKRPDKDIEFANREIKLEYRDEHGRLLTRKEAYRQLCYQFHGHGSSKKKEEKRLQQIEREQHERSANTGTTGTLGALKATQKATGKAFVLHKT